MKNEMISKLQRIANRCRTAKQWKGGNIAARSTTKQDVGDLYIYSIIGMGWFGDGVTADSVKSALDGLKGVKTLNVFINSEGGDVFEAKAIYTQLKRFPAEKVVRVDGLAASAATFIAMSGDRIITAPEATWMVHEAWGAAMGEAQDLRDYADVLDMQNEDIASIYAKKTGRSVEEMRAIMAAETWMTATEALNAKFTDAVETYNVDDEEQAKASNVSALEIAQRTTRERISASTSDLLAFRAKRAKLETEKTEKENRASAAKRATSTSR